MLPFERDNVFDESLTNKEKLFLSSIKGVEEPQHDFEERKGGLFGFRRPAIRRLPPFSNMKELQKEEEKHNDTEELDTERNIMQLKGPKLR